MSRLSFKQMTNEVEQTAINLGIAEWLHLGASNGYYQLQMFAIDLDTKQKTSGVDTLQSGTLQDINQYLQTTSFMYYVNRLKERLNPAVAWPNLHIAIGALNAALSDRWKTLNPAQATRFENIVNGELYLRLSNYGGSMDMVEYHAILRDSYHKAVRI